MSRLMSSKTVYIWAERIAQCERSPATVAQFCKSINCSPTSYYQWKRKFAAKPQATAFLRVQTSDSTKHSIEIKLPSGISILVPVSAVESISAILEQAAYKRCLLRTPRFRSICTPSPSIFTPWICRMKESISCPNGCAPFNDARENEGKRAKCAKCQQSFTIKFAESQPEFAGFPDPINEPAAPSPTYTESINPPAITKAKPVAPKPAVSKSVTILKWAIMAARAVVTWIAGYFIRS